MNPRFYHYLCAQCHWVAAYLGAVILVTLLGFACAPELHNSSDQLYILKFVVAFISLFLLGMILGTLLIWPFLCIVAVKINGGPFSKNDKVLILVKPQKNTISEVYEIWGERGQLRVYLDEEKKKAVKDVFGEHQVLRISI
jgi:hypothetical protein